MYLTDLFSGLFFGLTAVVVLAIYQMLEMDLFDNFDKHAFAVKAVPLFLIAFTISLIIL